MLALGTVWAPPSSRLNTQDGVVRLHLVVPRSPVSPPREPLPPQHARRTRREGHVVDTGHIYPQGRGGGHMLVNGGNAGLHVGGGKRRLTGARLVGCAGTAMAGTA